MKELPCKGSLLFPPGDHPPPGSGKHQAFSPGPVWADFFPRTAGKRSVNPADVRPTSLTPPPPLVPGVLFRFAPDLPLKPSDRRIGFLPGNLTVSDCSVQYGARLFLPSFLSIFARLRNYSRVTGSLTLSRDLPLAFVAFSDFGVSSFSFLPHQENWGSGITTFRTLVERFPMKNFLAGYCPPFFTSTGRDCRISLPPFMLRVPVRKGSVQDILRFPTRENTFFPLLFE